MSRSHQVNTKDSQRRATRWWLLLPLIVLPVSLAFGPAEAATADGGQSIASARVALDWNQIAVNTVRGTMTGIDGLSRLIYQTEGLIYLSYAHAAMYDAVTKISGRYVPLHDFRANTAVASPEAATLAAAYHVLVSYLGDEDGSLAAQYKASIDALPATGKVEGVAVGEAADLTALRQTDGRGATTATYSTIGPVVVGAWQIVPPSTVAQTPWIALHAAL